MAGDGKEGKLRLSPTAAISASLTLAAVAITAFVAIFAHAHDTDQIAIEQRIVGSAIKDALAKLADTLAPNTYWDIAYDKVTDRVDAAWAKGNLGPYAQQTSHISSVLIFDQKNRPIYDFVGANTHGIVAKDLAADSATTTLVNRALASHSVPPEAATGFVEVKGVLYLAAAEMIVPNDDRANAPLARRNVEVYFQEFDATKIAKVQNDFGVTNVTLERVAPPDGVAKLVLKDGAGADVAYLVWHAATPGRDFAVSILPFAIGIIALIGLLQVLALGGWRKTIRTLERKKIEADMLREESWSKTMILANMSHELRTPLNAVIGFSEVLSTELFGALSPQYRQYARDIHSSGSHLLSVVNAVLDLTKLQSSEDIELTPVSVARSTVLAVKILKERANAASIVLELDIAGEDLIVSASEQVLNQIVLNLGSNAIKFSPAHGTVNIAIVRDAETDRVRISVVDRGCGIPADKLPFIGRPFYQAQSSYARKSGTGLGVAIVRALVARLHGEFCIESRVGMGTSVTVMLPLHRNPSDIRDLNQAA